MKKGIQLIFCFIFISGFSYGQIPTNGLVARYDFSGNASDLSGNSNNGVVNNATLTIDRFGNANSAYAFDGTTSYIDIPNSASLSFSNTISIAFWAKINSVPKYGYDAIILSKQSGNGTTQQGFNVYANTIQTVGLRVADITNVGVSNDSNVSTGQYHHFVYVYNNGTGTSYLDGVINNTITNQTGTIGINTMDLLIGKANWTNVNAPNFNGTMDELLIYNSALTPLQVTQSYGTSCGSIDTSTGLVARYDFTGNANDLSGNPNNGTVNGATLTSDRFGNANNAYAFNGTTSYIDVPNSSSLQFANNIISISFWANINSVPTGTNDGIILSKQSGSGTTQQGFNVFDNASQTVGLRVANGTNVGIADDSNVSLNQYHHLVYVYDNGTGTSYLDGILTGTITGQTGTIDTNTMDLLIGKANWTNVNAPNFNGKLDDIRIYNRALSYCDVNTLYNMPDPTSVTTGITNPNNNNSFVVYPNPASNKATITTNDAEKTIQLFDIVGNNIPVNYVTSENKIEIDLSNVNSGMYFISINGSTQKIQVVK